MRFRPCEEAPGPCEVCGESYPDCDCEDCPCCDEILTVSGTIYCENGCELRWLEHGSLDVEGYPKPCPHVSSTAGEGE